MIRPGELRERVTVQVASGTTNALGETVLAWSDSSAREALLAGQQDAAITHKVRLRYLPGLTSRERFAWRGRTLEIVSLLEHGNRSQHEAICVEKR
jgi:SPP1 family predicted phage head-tail adaptor